MPPLRRLPNLPEDRSTLIVQPPTLSPIPVDDSFNRTASRLPRGRTSRLRVVPPWSSTCSLAISQPRSAHGSFLGTQNATLRCPSLPGGNPPNASLTTLASPGPSESFGSFPCCLTSPSTNNSHLPTSQSSEVKSCSFRIRNSERPCPTQAMATGWASFFCSHIAGCGVRSGQTRPSHTKLASWGTSPKSPP